ncbi:MAG: 6-aminohexanoate-dimer hydrolase [Alphaproteobacteria bacterium MarineAlpha4_Bin2]|nr:MAG: 6-aminohexanoate-dimer hydrolase [Alphaproteobacteria bacterium MarineAlpha4_Bin2]
MNNELSTVTQPAASEVTLANWRLPPFNRWGFQRVREIVPSADIPADPNNVWHLPTVASDACDSLIIENETGPPINFRQFLNATHTDAFILLHRGRTLVEWYANGMTHDTPHILMSVSKSMLGLIAGILNAKGQLDLEATAIRYIPELKGSAFEDVTIRCLLDMRSGLDFDEDYLATSGEIVQYRKATNWNPLEPGEAPTDLRTFLCNLSGRSGPNGGPFNYTSPCSDLLGWIIERATTRRFAELFAELIWKPLGAENNAYITLDRLGAPRCAGGICMTAMDLARVGQLIAQGGRHGETQVIPQDWLEDIVSGGDPAAWNKGPFTKYWPGRDMHYRSKWYVERGSKPLVSGYGIHGQHLFVDRDNAIVIAKLSSGPIPIDSKQIAVTARAIDTIRDRLSC